MNNCDGYVRLIGNGKARDIYEIPEGLVLVATDRISAFDVVFPTPIPDKGKVLNLLSAFWFSVLENVVPNHLIAVDPEAFPEHARPLAQGAGGRAMFVKRADVLPVECVVRGYLAGSAWSEYRDTGKACGYTLPSGLLEGEELPDPIFTPSTKGSAGHDRPLEPGELASVVGAETAYDLAEASLLLYTRARQFTAGKGIILADSKFEFGWIDGRLSVVGELFTPDSSRYWPADHYRPGSPIPSFDKQFVRDYVESIGWDKNLPAPFLPDDVVGRTREKYLEAFKRLTGLDLAPRQEM